MSPKFSLLTEKSLVLVLAYAPAGFGHLRVTDALYHGLPEEADPILLGAGDNSLTYIHRLFSSHPSTRAVMEWVQKDTAESVFTFFYRRYLRARANRLRQELEAVLNQRFHVPENLVVVATHFGLAHQLAEIKDQLAKEKGIQIILIVLVTDDSPQKIWYVEGADLTFVPSAYTRDNLMRYGRQEHFQKSKVIINPYPVSPLLTQKLTQKEQAARKDQLSAAGHSKIYSTIPISGAAVGTDYYLQLMSQLHSRSNRYRFHVICKQARYTQAFIVKIKKRDYITALESTHDRSVVDLYEQEYENVNFALEITKPSEQAFKCLLNPTQIGGPILLFTKPIGRQEYENLEFLRRHDLVPSEVESEALWYRAQQGAPSHVDKASWRGLLLPADPVQAATFINWSLNEGLLERMMDPKKPTDVTPPELGSNGVELFWKKALEFIDQALP